MPPSQHMGSYAGLLLIPASGFVLILLSFSLVHIPFMSWIFALQMSWQTLRDLGLSSQELDPQDVR